MDTNYDAYEKLRFSFEEGVATVTIYNPPVNLIDRALFRDLRRAVDQLERDDQVRVIVLRSGVPGWFVAHYDVNLIIGLAPITEKRTEPWLLQRMSERLRTMSKATIAVLEGRAGGGGSELALSCDMRFASPQTILNQPEVALGLLPGGSGSQRLPRLVGRSRALEAILGCDDIDALTAERWGWVNRVLPEDQLSPFVTRLAARIASFPPHAVAAAKAVVLLAEGDLVTDLVQEANASDTLASHPDTQAALQRFLTLGGQTVEGERRLGELAAQAAKP
ncbi:MAG: enoyl-CoA hydratase/isomerase family protein [Sulfuricaulis sp.]|nr:enoyl-CoA hydratase/isomerase family protein [Sulfuricaulis sp.]